MIRLRQTLNSSTSHNKARCPAASVERLEDRTLLATVTLVNNGPSANRADIVFLGDGYTTVDVAAGTYRAHVESMVRHLFAESEDPYPRYHSFFNVHMVEVISPESGIDNPRLQIWRNTALDASYNCSNYQRLICINSSKATQAALTAGVTPEIRLVTTNANEYGGGGGSWATYAGGSYGSAEIALHELGHSFNGLGDEYEEGCTAYTGSEPWQTNLTRSPLGQKWAHWLGYNQPRIGTIGVYPGGLYCHAGIYHPSISSKMGELGMPFDAVAREKIILDIYNLVNPLDGWLDNRTAHRLTDTLWVDVVDPGVITVEWYVDGTRVPRASGTSFRPSNFGFRSGTHTVTARAVDLTDWVRRDRQNLEQSVTWTVNATAGPVLPDPRPGPGTVEPTIEDATFVTAPNRAITSVVLAISDTGGLSEIDLENVAHYHLATPGGDRRFGTRDDRAIAIQSAVYDATLDTLTLTLMRPLAPNQLIQVTTNFANGSISNAAVPAAAIAGSHSGVIIGRGARLSYFDSDGDVVTIVLARGGVMELTMGPADQGPRLRLLDITPNRSVLSGKIRRGQPNGDGAAHLESISGMAGVVDRLAVPPTLFTIGAIAPAIDALLESRDLLGDTVVSR
jgi:hypothetical protein